MVSNAADKSMAIMPTTSPLLAAFSHSEWAFPSAVLQLRPFLKPC
jgi:hypothetical protein